MTRRERLELIIRGELTEELINECKEELKKLDERSAAALAKSKESEQYRANKMYEERVYEFLEGLEEPVQVGEILAEVAPGLTRQRMTAICTNLVREGRIRAVEVKVKGKGKRRAYIVQVLFFIGFCRLKFLFRGYFEAPAHHFTTLKCESSGKPSPIRFIVLKF